MLKFIEFIAFTRFDYDCDSVASMIVTGVKVTSTVGDAASAKPDSRSLACEDRTRKLSCSIISGHMVHRGHLLALRLY